MTGRALQSLRNDRHLGKNIPYIKFGKSVRYNINDVIEFMESRKIDTGEQMNIDDINNESERKFALNFFDHTKWEYQHKTYRFSNGKTYRPDFKDNLRDAIIEVVGTRQAFHSNKNKYAQFIKEFPNKLFEIRDSEGELIEKYMDMILIISKFGFIPKKKQPRIIIHLSDQQNARIKKMQGETGLSWDDLIGRAIDKFLNDK